MRGYGQAIMFYSCAWFLLLSFSFLRSQSGCLPYLNTWCGLSANLECRCEMCCTRLAENTGRKNYAKSPSAHHRTTLSSFISSHLRHISTIEVLLNSNNSSTCRHNMVNFGPLAAEIGWRVWGTPANFNGFRVLASLLHRRRSPKVNQTLHEVWPSPGLVYIIIWVFGSSCPLTEFCHV